MHKVALFGSGKIGLAITAILASSGRYEVRVCDQDLASAQRTASPFGPRASAHLLELDQESATDALLKGCDAVISALPFFLNAAVAKAARKNEIHYFDLTEDVETTKAVTGVAAGATKMFFPQCGLAPGFISIAAMDLTAPFDSVEHLKLRVGALPRFPSNMLKYNLTWSTEGLINEYGNVGEALIEGEIAPVYPLEGYERFELNGTEYEAFNTSGGAGSLCHSLRGKVKNLDYKSIRYPGHHHLISFLMKDLKFDAHREQLKEIFERSIPQTRQDKCVVMVEAVGRRGSSYLQQTYATEVVGAKIGGLELNAIQVSTASGVCVPLDMTVSGALSGAPGIRKNEEISLQAFLTHEFGRCYL